MTIIVALRPHPLVACDALVIGRIKQKGTVTVPSREADPAGFNRAGAPPLSELHAEFGLTATRLLFFLGDRDANQRMIVEGSWIHRGSDDLG